MTDENELAKLISDEKINGINEQLESEAKKEIDKVENEEARKEAEKLFVEKIKEILKRLAVSLVTKYEHAIAKATWKISEINDDDGHKEYLVIRTRADGVVGVTLYPPPALANPTNKKRGDYATSTEEILYEEAKEINEKLLKISEGKIIPKVEID